MSHDSAFLWAFFAVFVRASAMMLSSPFFGAQTTPVSIRVMVTVSIAGALAYALRQDVGTVPVDLVSMVGALAREALAGLVIGLFTSVAFSAFQMAGALLDIQVGLGASQVINPVNGVPSTLLAQFKSMLAVVIFVAMSGHHMLFQAFVGSYRAMPGFGLESLGAMQTGMTELVAQAALLGLQIAAPVFAVGIVVDAALGLVNRAVPQMPVMLVGMPAKVAMGLVALSVGLPALVSSVDSGSGLAVQAISTAFGGTR